MVNLSDIAAKLDADEKLELTYRFPVRMEDGQVEYETRSGRLLDADEDAKLFYVAHRGEVLWIKAEEAVSVSHNDDA